MDVDLLRRATAADHAGVEGAFPLMGEALTAAEYVAVLRRMHGMVAAWESLCEQRGPGWLQPMMKERQRRTLLEEDLRVLGSEMPVAGGVPRLPELRSDAEFVGAMYVMEGSRLGGLMIAKHVEAVLGLDAGQGDAYFRGGGERTGGMWREVLDVLRTRVSDEETNSAILAAQGMFRSFGEWMRGEVEATYAADEGSWMRQEVVQG